MQYNLWGVTNSSYELAKAYLASGDTSQALTRLERAYEERSHSMAFLKVDPPFTGLWDVPRYRALLGKVGLDESAAALPERR